MGIVSVDRVAPAVPAATRLARRTRAQWLVPALLLGGGCLALRVVVALTPVLRETYYDEALTGLMSLAILRGIPQVFYWGQPYLGALDAYLVAAVFWLFGPSTLALRLGAAWVSIVWLWAAWRIGRRVAGPGWGLFAALQLALPPIFVTYIQLSSHAEGISLALGTLTLAVAVRLVDDGPDQPHANWLWAALGIVAGLAWWMSQMTVMLLGAAALGLLVARPRALRRPGPYLALAMFVVGGLPFWIWNVQHEWATFLHLASWGERLPRAALRVRNVAWTLADSLQGGFWDSRAARLPAWARRPGGVVLAVVYGGAALLAAGLALGWVRRVLRRERPWQTPLDLVALAFWLTVTLHLLTWFGTSGVLRYVITFYGPLPLLAAAALARLAALGRPARAVALGLATAVLALNLGTHVAFMRANAQAPVRPVDALLAELSALGVTGCYADSRIAQVISFESADRVPCADYVGLRSFAHLQAVDRIEDPARVAIVTHDTLRLPHPSELAHALRRIGGQVQETRVGEYVIFHHPVPPDKRVRSIPPDGWRATASADAEHAVAAFDRRAWTRWSVPVRPGQWLEVDLGLARPVTEVSLQASPWPGQTPPGLQVELSEDGRAWRTLASDHTVLPGLRWWKDRPRLDDGGQVVVRFEPTMARYLRLTQIGAANPIGLWSIAELFVYEAAEPTAPAPAATEALADAEAALEHWMDDPGGPHPRRAPVTYEHRRAQVSWARVFGAANRALALAPEWEAAHEVYARSLTLANPEGTTDRSVDRARADRAWIEVTRWAALVERASGIPWRAGRSEAWVEALDRLERPVEAAARRAIPAPVPTRPVRVRFGADLDLDGVDLPAQARAGETVSIRYYWRLRRASTPDPWVFLHVYGLPGGGNFDQVVGAPGYGTSLWPTGERLVQAVTVTVPAETPPGAYPLRLGVWIPSTGRRLRIADSDLPEHHRAIALGTLTVVR